MTCNVAPFIIAVSICRDGTTWLTCVVWNMKSVVMCWQQYLVSYRYCWPGRLVSKKQVKGGGLLKTETDQRNRKDMVEGRVKSLNCFRLLLAVPCMMLGYELTVLNCRAIPKITWIKVTIHPRLSRTVLYLTLSWTWYFLTFHWKIHTIHS